jgi:anti-anti-sigma factor
MVAFQIVDDSICRTVSVFGDIDAVNAEAFERACSDSPAQRSIVDLRNCPYIDSTGLTALIKASRNGTLTLVLAPPSRTYRIFQLTDLLNYFTVVDTVEVALEARRSESMVATRASDGSI